MTCKRGRNLHAFHQKTESFFLKIWFTQNSGVFRYLYFTFIYYSCVIALFYLKLVLGLGEFINQSDNDGQ